MGLFLGTSDSAPTLPASDDAVAFVRRVLPSMAAGRYGALMFISNDAASKKWAKDHGREKPGMNGLLFTDPESLVSKMRAMLFRQRQADPKGIADFYLCLSLMRVGVARAKGPGLKAVRTIENFAAVRALWADLDVKEGAYAQKQDAINHIDQLVAAGSLPAPTVRVDSGYGLHCYWVLDRDLTLDEWEPFSRKWSEYLKTLNVHHDPQCTNDPVRVLRIPTSVNMKNPDSPAAVSLIGAIEPTDHAVSDIETLIGHNLAAAAVASQATRQPVQSNTFTLPAAFAGVTPPGAPSVLEFSSGIDPDVHTTEVLDFEAMLNDCPTLADIHDRGGAGDSEPLWALAILAASFAPASEREEWAHAFSDQDPRYTPEGTLQKLDEKVNARLRTGNRIGWPKCDQFAALSPKCQGCPFRNEGKSPLHRAAAAWKAKAVAVLHSGLDDALPTHYVRIDQEIFVFGTDEDGNPTTKLVLPYDIEGPHIEENVQGSFFVSRILHKRNPPTQLRLPLHAATAWRDEATKALGAAHIVLQPEQVIEARRFFVSYIQTLQAKHQNVHARDPYGWTKTRDGDPGFAYDGRVHGMKGVEHGPTPDEHLHQRFHTSGTARGWKAAADMVMGMGRLDLQAAIASAFAAPLVKHTGQAGALLSIFSPKSGAQKSTALKVAQAVWGNPITGMTRLDDTANSVAKKLGLLRHLPVYWDELQTRAQTEQFAKLAFALTMGTEKSRMASDTRFRTSGEWATLLVSGSNHSVRELMMMEQAAGSAAGVNRVLEIEVLPVALDSSAAAADQVLLGLNDNFGVVGETYARLLVGIQGKIAPAYTAIAKSFEQKVGADPEQRFWIMTASVLLLGARLANQLEGGSLIRFDIPAMHDFLCGVLRQQQIEKDDITLQGTDDLAASVVQGFIDHCKAENTYLETDCLVLRPGRPSKFNAIHVRNTSDQQRLMRVVRAHVAVEDGRARFHADAFREYVVKQRRLSFTSVKRDLVQHGNMTKDRARWCAGTLWAGSLQHFYSIDLHHASTALGRHFDLGHPTQAQAANTP